MSGAPSRKSLETQRPTSASVAPSRKSLETQRATSASGALSRKLTDKIILDQWLLNCFSTPFVGAYNQITDASQEAVDGL